MLTKLFETAPSKVRLSCRAADWLGESDLASLKPFFDKSGGAPAVLGLAALNEGECRAVLTAQSLTVDEANAFMKAAADRGLGEFLRNPQNLLMLLRVVRSGQWPETRSELYMIATRLLLEEADRDHALKKSGALSARELQPVAGAVLAVRLISDVEGIGLTDQSGTDAVPGYRSLSFLDLDSVRAALTRRVFEVGSAPGSVDYAHRVTAEYLGALWLSEAVRDGLPLQRVQALLGVDGHPAPELRGLHAWLAVHLPEFAPRLIEADPYGVLTYGDAASLSPSNCAYLVGALGRLSQTDPWFRRGAREEPAVGALSRADMVGEFRKVMRSENAGFGVRSIVVEALALGTPQLALKEDLAAVVLRSKSAYAERRTAIHALVNLGAGGKKALARLYPRLGKSVAELRLRADILRELYGDPCDPADVIALIDDVWTSSDELPGGVLWFLADAIPLSDVPAILDGVKHRKRTGKIARRNAWEIAGFYKRVLMRAWNELATIAPPQALRWLLVWHTFRDSYSAGDEFRVAIGAKPDRVAAVVDYFLTICGAGKNIWLDFYNMQEATLHILSPDQILRLLIDHAQKEPLGSAKRAFLYEAAFPFTWRNGAMSGPLTFAELYALGETDATLQPIRDRAVAVKLPDRYLERKRGRSSDDKEAEESRARHRAEFEANVESIRSGQHLGWLSFLAEIYYGLFSDLDRKAPPRDRLAFIIGDANVPAAIEGLKAVLTRHDLPTLKTVADLAAERRLYNWWRAILASLDERFAAEKALGSFSDDVLSAAIAFELTEPVYVIRDGTEGWRTAAWKQAAIEQRPTLVHDAYMAIARVRLSRGDQHIDGLHELLTEQPFAPYRAATVMEFLRDYPNANIFRLGEMLDAMLTTPDAHRRFIDLAATVIEKKVAVDLPQYDKWIAAAYIVAPARFESAVDALVHARPGAIFDLRDFGSGRHANGRKGIALTLSQFEFLARLGGSLNPYASPPSGGWNGDTNAWDASDYVNSLINSISANPSEVATLALSRLEAEPALASYKPFILNAKAQQKERRREADYDRPDWQRSVNAFSKGPPATVADLHAVLLGHLDDARTTLGHGNTDGYKVFWNLDRYGRPTEPLPEETCRDRLVDRLRPGLLPLSVTVEPEGHMAHDKRADMMVAMPARKILCELKRDYHSDVWTAAEGQLERFYTPDPDAGGFGVYAVFWFGDKRPAKISAAPGGQVTPSSATEMEQMLVELVPPERRTRIAVRVIDVSGMVPPFAKPKRKPKKVSRGRKHPKAAKKTRKAAASKTKKRSPAKAVKKKKSATTRTASKPRGRKRAR
ncbi:hypothetical protein QA640_44510 (plasmid) [Bradyrhizobium sp. CB82]|uniref:hypothetical protein n=1 Tax=Bradyrhizobium sp. CB82 TaxID=3039159 RepID=UPI0024B23D3B|nr:hypothetical protein [Bradyrhizobium sp. CB82]WFU45875.1 hypothetical protein QA640_44510 [Bradyrhizobium sp. CB82]